MPIYVSVYTYRLTADDLRELSRGNLSDIIHAHNPLIGNFYRGHIVARGSSMIAAKSANVQFYSAGLVELVMWLFERG